MPEIPSTNSSHASIPRELSEHGNVATQRNKNRPYSRWLSWIPPVAWAAMIFVTSSFPFGPKDESGEPNWIDKYHLDKPIHLALYGILCWLVMRALRRSHGLSLVVVVVWGVIITSAYGASDEWHQTFVDGRYSSVNDWLTDVAGAVLAATLFYRYESRRSTTTNR